MKSFFTSDRVYNDQAMNITFRSSEELGKFMAGTFTAMPDLALDLTVPLEAATHFTGEGGNDGNMQKGFRCGEGKR